MLGAAAILLGTAWLVLSTSGALQSAVLVAVLLASFGAVCIAIGLVRALFQLPIDQLPPIPWFGALALAGVIALIVLPPPILGWIGFYLPSDPRSQPSHVLGAILFFGSFATVFAVIGSVVFLSRLVRSRPLSRGIDAH
jgi:hypothetical protein